MRKLITFIVTLCLAGIAIAAEDQALLAIYADTISNRMAGIQAAPAGIPFTLQGKEPFRQLTVRLWSPGAAPENATAELVIPEGLKLDQKINLGIRRPQDNAEAIAGFDPDANKEFTVKIFRGSADAAKEGQPEVIRWDKLNDEQRAALREAVRTAAASQSTYFKANWTTAYWPDAKEAKTIANDAKLAGKYALTTSYTGNVEITVPDNVDFLAPIELVNPDLNAAAALDSALKLKWNAVNGAQAYHAMIFGLQGKDTLVIWDSSEAQRDISTNWDTLDIAQIAEQVQEKALLAADATELSVPAGIFNECDLVFMHMVGFGQGAAANEGQPLPRVQTRTVLNVLLGGKAVNAANNAEAPADAGIKDE